MKKALVVFAVLSSFPVVAAADDTVPSTTPVQDRSRFGLTAGVLTPTGELGAEYTWVASPRFEVGLGAGVGAGWRPQGSVMPRLRWSMSRTTLSLGTGLSAGEYTSYGGDFGFEYAYRTPVLWSNTEAGVMHTWDNGLFVRAAGGVGVAVAHGKTTGTADVMEHAFSDRVLPYFGVTLGHTL